MKEANETTIQELPHGQLLATIPRSIGRGMEWKKGDIIVWKVDKKGGCYVTRK